MKAFPYENANDPNAGDAELRALFARRAEALPPVNVPSLESVLAEADDDHVAPMAAMAPVALLDRPPRARVRVQRVWAATVATLAVAASVAGLRLGVHEPGEHGISAEPRAAVDSGAPSVGVAIAPGETCEAPPVSLASSGDVCALGAMSPRAPTESSYGATCDQAPMSDPPPERLTCERELLCSFATP